MRCNAIGVQLLCLLDYAASTIGFNLGKYDRGGTRRGRKGVRERGKYMYIYLIPRQKVHVSRNSKNEAVISKIKQKQLRETETVIMTKC